jgi:hypothetical protein
MLTAIAVIIFVIGSLAFGTGIRGYMFPKVTTQSAAGNVIKSFIVGAIFLSLLIGIYKGCSNRQSDDPSIDYDGNR